VNISFFFKILFPGRTCRAIPLLTVALFAGCATYDRYGLKPEKAKEVEAIVTARKRTLTREQEERILALDPRRVTAKDVAEALSNAPAPRIMNIHGGIHPVHERMISFSEFLMGMGYPRASIQNPVDGTWTFSCYESSHIVAGTIAWYYEKEALRPMIVGHSQGGFQAVKVLDMFAGKTARRIKVWNPLLWQMEDRAEIIDPLTGQTRPVVGLVLPYVAATGAGGVTRFLPNQWTMNGRLRTIPDSVEEFTGFYKGRDLLGGDFWGYGPANLYHPNGKAIVRNIELPAKYKHGAIPDTKHLLASPSLKEWIDNYQPPEKPVGEPETQLEGDTRHIIFAAEVWYSIKKHWVLELQHYIRARRAQYHAQR
jgi:hypothetical protein